MKRLLWKWEKKGSGGGNVIDSPKYSKNLIVLVDRLQVHSKTLVERWIPALDFTVHITFYRTNFIR